jgi:hypothetical protein
VPDVDKIRSVLIGAPKVFAAGVPVPTFGPGAVKTFNGTADTRGALVRAWSAWLGMRGDPEDFATFKAWADLLQPWEMFDAFDGVQQVPWESLIRAGVPIDDVVGWLCTRGHLDWLKQANGGRFGEPFALLLWRLAALAPKRLSLTGWVAVAEALASLLPDSPTAMLGADGFATGEDVLRASFGVLAAWEQRVHAADPSPEKPTALLTLRGRLEQLTGPFLLLRASGTGAVLTLAQLNTAADVIRFDRTFAAREIQALADTLDADWRKVIAFCKANHWQVRHAVDFLAALVETTSAGTSSDSQQKILELGGLSSSVLDGLSRILDPTLWTADAWAQLTELLREAGSGARGRFPGSARSDLCDLVRRTLRHTHRPMPSDLGFLARTAMDLTAHEDATVANRAAYAVTRIAEWGIAPDDSALAEEVAQTIRGMARDARPGVRGAAANALGFLGRSSHPEMRGLVVALASLADDPNAHVHSEWAHGQCAPAEGPE